MSTDDVLRIVGLRAKYPRGERPALDGIDLRQARGQMIAVAGSTGAGKSTLFKCVSRILPELQPAEVEGTIEICGASTVGLRVNELAGRLGVVFQDFEAQLFSTRVLEEVLFGLEQLGVPSGEMLARARAALDDVGLAGFERRDPMTLSGGEKQRLALAAVLATRPDLLLLDEPSTDLDPAGRRDLFTALARLRSAGTSFCVAEHELERLAAADHFLVLDEGRVAFAGTPAEVFARVGDLEALGLRPPELASLCVALGLPAWPIDVDSVASRITAAGIRPRGVEPAPAPPIGDVVLSGRGLRHRYVGAPREALAGVSLEMRAGEFVALVGSNGSGKSTLARVLAGLVTPTSGAALLRGATVAELPPRERVRIGYVFQDPDEQIFSSSVGEEIAFGLRALGFPGAEIERRVATALDHFDLRELADRDPFLLAKGDRQRVAVASILALEPDVLILDEPTTGLDALQQRGLMDRLERQNRKGTTIVIITHVPWVVARYARRAVLMNEGQVLFDGSVRELFAADELCRQGDFLPTEAVALGRRFGLSALTVEELLTGCRDA